MSVDEMVADAQDQMQHELPPAQARDLLVKMTALLGNVLDACVKADHAYNVVLLRFLDADEPANRAKIRAETSLEYIAKRRAHNTELLVVEMVRSLKVMIKSTEEEMRMAR